MSRPQHFRSNLSETTSSSTAAQGPLRPTARCLNALGAALAVLMGAGTATPAHAVDGCVVLLCFAAPSWRAIAHCVPPIRQVLRDLARGRAFPSCGMSGAGNSAANELAHAPDNCPPQYTRLVERPNGPVPICLFNGAVAVNVRGEQWSRTWWNLGGDSVTEFSAVAKQQMGQWDTQFDDDYARWLASPQPPTPCTDC